jgi:hypothetical protein
MDAGEHALQGEDPAPGLVGPVDIQKQPVEEGKGLRTDIELVNGILGPIGEPLELLGQGLDDAFSFVFVDVRIR